MRFTHPAPLTDSRLKSHYNYVPPEVYRTCDFPGAGDLANMFQYKRDFNDDFCATRPIGPPRELDSELQSFQQWLTANGSRIPLA